MCTGKQPVPRVLPKKCVSHPHMCILVPKSIPTPPQQSLCQQPFSLGIFQTLIQSFPSSLSHDNNCRSIFARDLKWCKRNEWVFSGVRKMGSSACVGSRSFAGGEGMRLPCAQSSWKGNGAGCKCRDRCWQPGESYRWARRISAFPTRRPA